jgi:hypothetical protein
VKRLVLAGFGRYLLGKDDMQKRDIVIRYYQTLLEKQDDICNTSLTTLTSYADDITVILECSQKIEDVRRIFTDFENACPVPN